MGTIAEELEAKGREAGLRAGREEGREAGLRETLGKLLRSKFGDLPEHTVLRLEQAGAEKLEQWIERVLDAPTLDDVFS